MQMMNVNVQSAGQRKNTMAGAVLPPLVDPILIWDQRKWWGEPWADGYKVALSAVMFLAGFQIQQVLQESGLNRKDTADVTEYLLALAWLEVSTGII